MHYAICWDFILFNKQSAGNLHNNKEVTSETTRVKSYNNNNSLKFFQWLAGIIDGNGSLLVSKRGYTNL